MSRAYKIHKQEGAYFLTFQIVYWVDLFSRQRYRDIVVDGLNFCVKEKGLEIYSYVIMSNHLHMILRSSKENLSDVIRDFKRHTSRHLVKSIFSEPESRRDWILKLFAHAANSHERNENYQVWTHENHPEEIFSPEFTFRRINYIHNNPVRAGIVENAEDYLYSSARDYAGTTGFVTVEKLNLHLMKSR